MWSWSLNWAEITPTVVVGTCPMTPADVERIRNGAGVSAILSVQHDDCHAYWNIDYRALWSRGERLGLAMARCPIRDFDIEDMRRQLPAATATLAGLQAAGHRTYVHCTAGRGRAPLTVLTWLSLVEGLHPDQAIGLILRARPSAVPAWEAYHGCVADLVARHRPAIEWRAYELYQDRVHDNAEDDWRQAEAEVLRAELLRGPHARSHRVPRTAA